MPVGGMSTLQHFHEDWWGNNDLLCANVVVHLPAFSDLQIFALPGPRLLVRKEYIYLFGRLQRFGQRENYYSRGVVLNGHSGIGKSMFLFYALIRCLQESWDVIFYFFHRTLVFSKDGVQEIDLNKFPHHSFRSPIWCLIDSFDGEHPPVQFLRHGYIFPILASSRPDEAYSSWAKRRCVCEYIMNPWSDEEISIGVELLSRDEASLILYQSLLPQVLNFCGPIIRDVYSCLLSQGSTAIIDNIYGPHPCVYNAASLVQVLTTFHCSTLDNLETPCSAALKFRRPARSAAGSDDIYLDFRSPRLAQEVWDQLVHLGYEDARDCFSRFSYSPTRTVAGRWLFQAIAWKQICRQTTQFEPLAPLQEMSLAEGTRTFIDPEIRNHHCLSISGAKRRPVFYSSATEIVCDETSFYIPRKVTKDFLFNGLFFGHSPSPEISGPDGVTSDPTILYILRITTEAENEGSELEVNVICEILRRYPDLVPIYLLVVPLPKPNSLFLTAMLSDSLKRSWAMPQSWFKKCPGRVFCQSIKIGRPSVSLSSFLL
ncbi:uncharacterized protein ARMOST_12108 [Armillaria ostoyae]|uniref:Uncharacterized protein n=1 Tax=Armillaria ostoyae TaxID=47428 RepID=A0A284RIZ4_ARMOS|nr:uncharacterized protein ARMOST_12108 [Armillaria ostoyae]